MDKKTKKKDGWIYGRRPVLEALRAGRREIWEVIVPSGPATDEVEEMISIARARRLPVRAAQRGECDRILGQVNHQCCAVKAGGYPYVAPEEIYDAAEADPEAIVLLLDHLEDPQNVGSLLRTAEACGVCGVILPEDRGVLVTPTVVRASVGASEHLKIAHVVNLAQAMKELKERNVWLTGLDMTEEAKPFTEVDFRGRCGIVVGSEGNGLGSLVGKTCDFIGYIPMMGQVESLNAGVAGALAMYEAVRQKAARK
ncbi:MAG: 23S rRNA (guanosine(2251)-2'-O)-methyltransferase RlmB [Lentisphaeraceae bacterium]|nr:23S rRNA (guanosine(2251)-2'-O)-methyltransferase RlmB [Lentisphaeraceae bacterium]